MNNKVETLRAICFTREDLENIRNLGDAFSKKDIEFVVEFKKIYELGIKQLEKFIDKLEKEGKDLDTYSIIYYVKSLLNGPLSQYVLDYLKEKDYDKYFLGTPDSLGVMGNKMKNYPNITIFEKQEYPLGAGVDSFNKLPEFMQKTFQSAMKISEDVFRSGLRESSIHDNTLPIVDKKPQERYTEEKEGTWTDKANANYMVKDRYYYLVIDYISQKIFEKVKDFLGDENFRLFKDKKEYNAFSSDFNESKSINTILEKEYKEKDKIRKIELDMMGTEFDSEKRREAEITISNPDKDKKYKLNTNEGQLGN